MIIDLHVHHCLSAEPRTDFAAMDRIKHLAQAVGISHVCLLGNVFRYGIRAKLEGIRKINDATIEMVQRDPAFVSGLCFMNPTLPRAAIREEVERCVRAGLVGVKLEIDLNARDKRMRHVMEAAADFDVPVLHHAWYKTHDKYPHESDPSDIADLARRFPANRIIMAHIVAAGVRGVLDVADCENVMVDTSGSQPVAGIIEYAVRMLGADRVIFGSDVCGRDFSCQLGKVIGADLKASDRRKVLYDNARKVLKLEGGKL